jgi:DNA-binding MarR family transcriptional regulator
VRQRKSSTPQEPSRALFARLAAFRYQLRKFLRYSERVARSHGLTPQRHQLLLGTAGFSGRGWATISELAEFLQERHNAVVGLVQRAEQGGLVRKSHPTRDRRFVRVHLTPHGRRLLTRITRLHVKEIEATRNASPSRPLAVVGRGRASSGEPIRKGR